MMNAVYLDLGIDTEYKKAHLRSFLDGSPPRQERISNEVLDEIIRQYNSRRESLEKEREDVIPEVKEADRENLGDYFKFVNREKSINILIKHAAKQYALYGQEGGAEPRHIQWAACSGGPGLGKTTFCRKGFTRSVVDEDSIPLWYDVPTKEEFFPVVQSCVETGRQYQISFGGTRGGQVPGMEELQNPVASFSYRLLKCLTKGKNQKVPLKKAPLLRDVLLKLTKETKESLIVVNFDETNKILDFGEEGKNYLMRILSAVEDFNLLQQGFVYCIMSGTNVRGLHDTLKIASSGNPPLEIPLPLLGNEHMVDILEDLARRINKSSAKGNVTVGENLKFVMTVLGGVPRYIEVLVFLLGSRNGNFVPSIYVQRLLDPPRGHDLLAKTRQMINVQYGSTFQGMVNYVTAGSGNDVWPALVSASLFRWKVGRETKFGVYEVQELEKEGILFVKTIQDPSNDTKSLTIEFPLLLMSYILQSSWIDVPMLLRYFDVPMSPDENERNTLAILALMCQGLRVLQKPITVNALLPGYAPRLRWRDIPLEFDHVYLQQMENQITLETWSAFESEAQEGLHGFFVNAKGATFSDTLIIPKNPQHVILIQEKQSEDAKNKGLKGATVPKFKYDLVEEEHGKCNVDLPHLFIIVSDKDFANEDRSRIKDNEIVLPCTEHEKAIGPLLALLRHHNHDDQDKVRLPLKKIKR